MSIRCVLFVTTRTAGAWPTWRANCNLSAQALIDTIFADLDRFNRVLFDDQTLLALKVK